MKIVHYSVYFTVVINATNSQIVVVQGRSIGHKAESKPCSQILDWTHKSAIIRS
jgi:hypothetical protein